MPSFQSPWAVALVVIKFDEKHGQQIQSIFPRGALPQELLGEMKMLSMPDCLEPGSTHEFQFLVRVRDKRPRCNGFLNCYISFRQCRDSSTRRGYFQQSVMLVSKLSFVTLSFNVLSRLSGVLADIPGLESLTSSSTVTAEENDLVVTKSKIAPDPNSGVIDATLEVGFQHFLKWPSPQEGMTVKLPFYGNMFTFTVPRVPSYFNFRLSDSKPSIKDLLKHGGLDGASGIFSSLNLVHIFGRLGLIPHLWTLWELMATGQDIVVWAPSAAICSSVVTALASLLAPLVFGGDFRPYINPYDTDVALFSQAANKKFEDSSQSAICLGSARSDAGDGDDDDESDSRDSNDWLWNSAIAKGLARLSDTEINGANNVGEAMKEGSDKQDPQEQSEVQEENSYVRSIDRTALGRPPIMLVGITNPFLLKSMTNFQAAIFLPNPEASPAAHKASRSASGPSSSQMDLSSFLKAPVSSMSSYLFSTGTSTPPPPIAPQTRVGSESSGNISPTPSYHRTIISPLGVDISHECNPDRDRSSSTSSSSVLGSKKKNQKKDYSEPAFQSNLHVMASGETLEMKYDEWTAAGGLQRGTCTGLVCVRNSPLLVADVDILQRLSAMSTEPGHKTSLPINGLDGSGKGYLGVPGSVGLSSGGLEGFDDIFDSERTAVGNLMLREHFKSLTLTLLRPFEQFFKPVVPDLAFPPTGTGTGAWAASAGAAAGAGGGAVSGSALSSSPSLLESTLSSSNSLLSFASAALSAPASALESGGIAYGGAARGSSGGPRGGGEPHPPHITSKVRSRSNSADGLPPLPETLPNTPAVRGSNGSARHTLSMSGRGSVGATNCGGSGNVSDDDSVGTAASAVVPTSTRAGASLMVLYSDPRKLLGKVNVAKALDSYFAREGAEASLPRCLRKTNWRAIFTLFGESDNFRAWRDWRRDLVTMQMLLESSEACNGLTPEQLIAAFAIEQGSDQLTQEQINVLMRRIEMTIKCLEAIGNSFATHMPSPPLSPFSGLSSSSFPASSDSQGTRITKENGEPAVADGGNGEGEGKSEREDDRRNDWTLADNDETAGDYHVASERESFCSDTCVDSVSAETVVVTTLYLPTPLRSQPMTHGTGYSQPPYSADNDSLVEVEPPSPQRGRGVDLQAAGSNSSNPRNLMQDMMTEGLAKGRNPDYAQRQLTPSGPDSGILLAGNSISKIISSSSSSSSSSSLLGRQLALEVPFDTANEHSLSSKGLSTSGGGGGSSSSSNNSSSGVVTAPDQLIAQMQGHLDALQALESVESAHLDALTMEFHSNRGSPRRPGSMSASPSLPSLQTHSWPHTVLQRTWMSEDCVRVDDMEQRGEDVDETGSEGEIVEKGRRGERRGGGGMDVKERITHDHGDEGQEYRQGNHDELESSQVLLHAQEDVHYLGLLDENEV